MDRADIELMHYGVKGMKWGRRRTDAQLAAAAKKRGKETVEVLVEPGKRVQARKGSGYKPTEEAVAAAGLKQIAKSSTTDALTNAQLKTLNERMNLEQNFANLSSKEAERNMSKGQKFVKNLGKTLTNSVQQQAQQNINKQIKEALN